MTWGGSADWWIAEVASDPAYREVVEPLILELCDLRPGDRILDVGCGEGRIMSALARVGARPVGCDLDLDLLRRARGRGPVVRCRLPDLGWAASASFDGAVMSLVLEHLPDVDPMLAELGRVVRRSGFLVVVVNHPVFTAPGSAPVVDTDGEVLWRPGRYLDVGYTDEPAGDGAIRFHHRPLSGLVNAAAEAGWMLERMVEQGVTAGQVARSPSLAGQEHIPRLAGFRWRRRGGVVA